MAQPSARQPDVLRILRSRIIRGVYTGKMPGGRKLATDLGTSVATIDLSLSTLQMLGLVRRSARSGTYVVPQEERVGNGSPILVQVVAPRPSNNELNTYWYAPIVYGFEQACSARGLVMVLHYAGKEWEADDAVKYVLHSAASANCAGTCLFEQLSTRHALELRRAKAPVVAADWDFEEPLVPTVTFDNIEAGALLARHVLSLGHRRVAVIVNGTDGRMNPISRDRVAGITRVLAAHGLSPVLTITDPPDWERVPGILLNASPRPTAVLGTHYFCAESVFLAAKRMGLRMPEDMSIASFNDPTCTMLTGLTVAALEYEAFGRLALESLLDEDLWKTPARRLVPITRVVGRTTAPPPAENP